jgi:hypothetical protein
MCQQNQRRRARRALVRTTSLILSALIFPIRMPPALWLNGGDARFLLRIRQSRRAGWMLYALTAVLLLGLIGPLTFYQYEICVDRRSSIGTVRSGGGPWLAVTAYDVWGEHQPRAWYPSTHEFYGQPERPRIDLCGLFISPDAGFRWAIDWRWYFHFTTPTIALIVVPLTVWLVCNGCVRGLMRYTSAHLPATQESRDLAIRALARASFMPIRAAWVLAFAMVVPLVLAPAETARLRGVVWWAAIGIATAVPTIILTRSVWADRANFFVRNRSLAALAVCCTAGVSASLSYGLVLLQPDFFFPW